MVHTFDFSERNDRVTLKLEVGQVVYIPGVADIRSITESSKAKTTKAMAKIEKRIIKLKSKLPVTFYNRLTGK